MSECVECGLKLKPGETDYCWYHKPVAEELAKLREENSALKSQSEIAQKALEYLRANRLHICHLFDRCSSGVRSCCVECKDLRAILEASKPS